MRLLSGLLVGLVFLSCGERPMPVEPAAKASASASADCSLAEIFSGKEGCREDPSLDEVPAGYVPPVDTTATAPADTLATAPADTTETAPADTLATAPADSPEAETPSDTAPDPDPELVVPDPVVVHVPGEEEEEPEVARSTALTAEQARAQLDSLGIAYTGAAFRLAAQSGNLEVVQLFVQAGMSLEEADDYDWTALSEAAYAGRLETVKYLVGQGANIEARDEDGWTVLMNAAGITNNLAVVRFLVESGADVLAVGDDQRTTAWSVAVTVGNTAIADYLKSLVPLDSQAAARAELARLGIPYTASAFADSVWAGNLVVVKLFVQAGMDVNTRDEGWTVLMLAAMNPHVHLAVVQYLVGAGADVHATTKDGWTALHYAAFTGPLEAHMAVVQYLVGAGADHTAETSDGRTPLDLAARNDHSWTYLVSLRDDDE